MTECSCLVGEFCQLFVSLGREHDRHRDVLLQYRRPLVLDVLQQRVDLQKQQHHHFMLGKKLAQSDNLACNLMVTNRVKKVKQNGAL